METLLKSESAMDILATISLAQFFVIVAFLVGAIILVYKFRDGIKEFLEDYRHRENRKEEMQKKFESYDAEIQHLKKHHEEDMEENYKRQLGYREQSLEKQANIEKHFSDIDSKIDNLIQMVNAQHEETREIKRNELREKLLNMYRFYTSIEQNPKQEWNEMEAEVFWDLFKDYEKLGGNGFMHNTVKPAMKALKVVTI